MSRGYPSHAFGGLQAVKFTANEFYKGVVPMGHWYSLYASGALAGMTECIFIAAPETVKVI